MNRRVSPLTAVDAAVAAAALLTGSGCTAGEAATRQPADGRLSGTITVFAAASLTGPFQQIADDFQRTHPGTRVVLNFAGSSTLAKQLNEGAPADVFAAADPISMQVVADAGANSVAPVIFVQNQLVIAVESGNPLRVNTLTDLARPGIKVALCAEQVPCGRATAAVLATSGVALQPVTYEQDVRAALTRVSLGEVDAALVYHTDARSAAGIEGVQFPESASVVNQYPITVLGDAPNPALAAAFVDYVRSPAGMSVLRDAGFQEP